MFKIVETIEKGKKQLTIVPANWENKGKLYWPKTRAEKFIEDSKSMPDDNWLELKCKVKRNYLLNKEIAEEELGRMLDTEETEQEDEDTIIPKRSFQPLEIRKRAIPKQNIYFDHTTDFNELAEACDNVNNW